MIRTVTFKTTDTSNRIMLILGDLTIQDLEIKGDSNGKE